MKQLAKNPFLFGLTAAAVMLLLPRAFETFLQELFGVAEAALFLPVSVMNLVVVVLLALLLPGEIWDGLGIGFHGKGLGKSIFLCLPMLVESVYSLGFYAMEGFPSIRREVLALAAVHALQAGITEELVFRGLILGNFLYQWRDRSSCVIKALTVSAVLFSFSHLNNLLSGQDWLTTLLQLVFTFAVGCLTGMAYLRTHNLLGPILIHCLHNLITLGLESVLHGSVDVSGAAAFSILAVKLLSYGAILGFSLIMLRKKEALAIWNEESSPPEV